MGDKCIINEILLQKVDKYIDKLAFNLNENKDELNDFKEEMKSNLISSIAELIHQGQSEQDAYQIAIERFGKVEYLEKELNSVYNIKKVFVKWLLILSITVGILSIGALIFAEVVNVGKINGTTMNDIKNVILKNIGTQENFITENMKKELALKVSQSKNISALGITIGDNNVDKLRRNYIFVFPTNTMYDYYGNIATVRGFFNKSFSGSEKFKIPNTDKTMCVDINVTQITYALYNVAYSLFLIYWVLFAVWASINIIHSRRNKLWIILVCLINLLGYALYKLHLNYKRININN